MARQLRYEYVVAGKGRFPLDMLRYDACYPTSPDAVASLAASLHPPANLISTSVRLASYVKPPTFGRWDSFGWTVVEASATDDHGRVIRVPFPVTR